MSCSYILYHNHVRTSIPYTSLPEEDQDILRLFHRIVKDYLNKEWKSDEKYVLMNERGNALVYDKGTIYRMSDNYS
jgi:coproporphyrinogen III oxidase